MGGIIPSQNSGYKVTRLCSYCIMLLFCMLSQRSAGLALRPPGVFTPLHSTPLHFIHSPHVIRLPSSPPLLRLRFRLRIRHCGLRHPFLCCLKVYPLLLPPPPRHPHPHSLRGPLTEFQNRSRRNVLCDRILPPCDGLPDPFKPHLSHGLLQRRVCPLPVPPSPRLSSGDPERGPVQEAL